MSSETGLTREESDSLLNQPTGKGPKRSGRKILFVLGGLLVVLVGVVALLPMIAGPFVRGREVFRSDQVMGTVQSASLGWFGSQNVRLALTDLQNKPAGALDVTVDRGLLGLATNWNNLGTVRVMGDVELREGAGPATAGAPAVPATGAAPASGKKEVALPKGLQARIELSLTKLSVLDKAMKPLAELKDVKAVADVMVGTPLTLDVSAVSGTSPLSVKVKVDNWSDANGLVRYDSASLAKNSPKVDASVSAESLSVALIDAIVATTTGTNQDLRSVLGETVTVHSQATGDYNGGSAGFDMTSTGAQASAKLTVRDGALSLAEPVKVRVQSAGTKALIARFVTKEQMGALEITEAPGANLLVEKFSIKLPGSDGKLDLRGGAVAMTAQLDKAQGRLSLTEGQPSTLEIPGFKASLNSDDLAGTTRILASASSTITTQGQTASAGDLNADIAISGLLDNGGAPVQGLPKSIDGKVSLKGASTSILQPFVAAALTKSGVVVDLPRDLGPTADIDLVAKSASGAIDIDLNARAQSAGAIAALRITDDAIVSRDAGISARLASAGQIAARALKGGTLSLSKPTGQVAFDVKNLNVPLDKATRKPKLDRAGATAHAEISAFSVLATLAPGEGQVAGKPAAIDLQTLNLDAVLKPGAGATAKIDGDATANGSPVKIAGDLSLPNVGAALGAGPAAAPNMLAKLLGAFYTLAKIQVTGVPSSLAEAMPHASTPGLNMAGLAREALGDTFSLSFETVAGASADSAKVHANIDSTRTKLALLGDISGSNLKLTTSGTGTITPGLFDSLLAGNAPDKPKLRAPAPFTLTSEPVDVPLNADGSPNLAKAGTLKARLAIAGQAIVQTGDQAYGAQDLTVNVSLPLSTLGTGAGGDAAVQATAGLLSSDGSAMGALAARVGAPLGPNLTLTGPAAIEVRLSDLQTAGLDRAINQPGMLSGALGPTAQLTATTSVVPPPGKSVGLADAFSKVEMAADVTLVTQRLEIARPLHARVLADRISLESPDPIKWTIDPAWFDRFVLGKGQGAKDVDLKLASPCKAELVIAKAVISRADSAKGIEGPAHASCFALDATARIPAMEFVDSRSVRTQMGDAVLKLQSQAPSAPTQGPGVAFDLSFGKLAIVPDPGKSGPGGGSIKGNVVNITTPGGKIDAANPSLTAKGDIRSIPTALVDAFSLKNGLPNDILGPALNISLDAQSFSKAGGSITLNGSSTETGMVTENGKQIAQPRAELSMQGTVANNVMTAPLSISLRRIEVGLEKRISTIFPSIGEIEKTYDDKRAVINCAPIVLPFDGDLRKLNGNVTIDPGDARFKISGGIGSILRDFNGKDKGKILQRLQPLTVTIRNGVLTYPRWAFPVGEFSIEVEGTMDLPANQQDLIYWIPAGRVANDVMSLFSKIPGVNIATGTIDKTTMLPFRSKGPIGTTSATPDLGLFGQSAIKSVNPANVIDSVKDIFKKPK